MENVSVCLMNKIVNYLHLVQIQEKWTVFDANDERKSFQCLLENIRVFIRVRWRMLVFGTQCRRALNRYSLKNGNVWWNI